MLSTSSAYGSKKHVVSSKGEVFFRYHCDFPLRKFRSLHVRKLMGILCFSSLNYLTFARAKFEAGNFGHVLELHDLSVGIREKDVLEMFDVHREERGFEVVAVNGTTYLGIFSSAEAGGPPAFFLTVNVGSFRFPKSRI